MPASREGFSAVDERLMPPLPLLTPAYSPVPPRTVSCTESALTSAPSPSKLRVPPVTLPVSRPFSLVVGSSPGGETVRVQLPPVTVALPFKLIFFVLVDGWSLVAGSLVQSYGG